MKRFMVVFFLLNVSPGFSQDTLDCGGKIVVFMCNYIRFDSIAFNKYDNPDLVGKWKEVKARATTEGKDSIIHSTDPIYFELLANREGYVYNQSDTTRNKGYWFYVPGKNEIHFMDQKINQPDIFSAGGYNWKIKKLNKKTLILTIVRGRKNTKYTLTLKKVDLANE
jgi:hypothetical protein